VDDTLSVALHPNSILALIEVIFSDDLDFAVFRHQRSLRVIHLEQMHTSVVAGTRDTVSVINEADGLYSHPGSLVAMCQACSVYDILLQSNRIPDFDSSVIGAGDEEVVVGCDDDSIDWSLVLGEMCNERSFRMPILERVRSVVVKAERLSSRGQWQWFAKIGAIFKMRVLIELLQQIQNVWIISGWTSDTSHIRHRGGITVGVNGWPWSRSFRRRRGILLLLIVFKGQRVEADVEDSRGICRGCARLWSRLVSIHSRLHSAHYSRLPCPQHQRHTRKTSLRQPIKVG